MKYDFTVNHGQVSHPYSKKNECPVCNEFMDLTINIKPKLKNKNATAIQRIEVA